MYTTDHPSHRHVLNHHPYLWQQLPTSQEGVGGAHVHEYVVECILRLGAYVRHEFSRVVLRPFALVAQVAYGVWIWQQKLEQDGS